jgi:phosphoribosylformylglycinamidine synthase
MPTALVITAAGTNCERELAWAFESAGASADLVHLNRLLEDPGLVDRYDLIGLPGGFSYGDAIAAGRVVAALMRQALYPAFVRAVERGAAIIAPCNGFQVAVQIGLLPGPAPGEPWPPQPPQPAVALCANESARFVDRWCRVEIPPGTRCIWTRALEQADETSLLPVAHAEGRFVSGDPALLNRLARHGQIALRYRAGDNPNGSQDDIAGICDASGLVFGLMPHPERYTRWTHHPRWTRLPRGVLADDPPGLRMFRNAIARAGSAAAV